ncbi:MAG TPA: hypothetical protein PLH46_06345 [Caldisericia bacterium]|nr:hypothetical protein [Caldisericia bacterium]
MSFKNYYLVKVVCEMLVEDDQDPINSSISLENRISEKIGDTGLEIEIKTIEILEQETFHQTHTISNSTNNKLQKIENDDGTYYYRTLNNYGENIITKIDHVQIDGKDFVNVYGDLFLVKEFNYVNTNVLSKYQDMQIVYTAIAGGLIGVGTSSKKSTKDFKISKKIKEIP